jgi:hypothetical protein
MPGSIQCREAGFVYECGLDPGVVEHREGIEPSNTGFADQRVSHFATGAHWIAAGSLTERLPQDLLLALGGKILLRQIPGFYRQPRSAPVGALAGIFHRSRRGHNDRLSQLPIRRD